MWKKCIYFFICMYLLFNITPGVMSENFGKVFYHSLSLIILVLMWRDTRRLLVGMHFPNGKILVACLLFLFAMVWGGLIIVIRDGESSGLVYLGNAISNILRFTALTVLTMHIWPNDTYGGFMKMYIICNCLYVLASLVMLVVPEIRLAWMDIVPPAEKLIIAKGDALEYYTRYGLSGFSGFTNTLFCSIAVWMCLYLLEQNDTSRFWNIAIIVLMLGNMLYGRSGLIISSTLFLVMNLSVLSTSKIKSLLLWGIFSGVLMFGIVWYINLNPNMMSWKEWVIEPFVAFMDALSYGEISLGDSGNNLVDDMYFIPADDYSIFLGDGRLNNADGTYYMHTDAGFMREMFFYGLLGMFFSYTSLLMVLDIYYHCAGEFPWHKKYVIALLFIMALMEFKGSPLNYYYGCVWGLLASYMAVDKKKVC